jgi:hypothetical protein
VRRLAVHYRRSPDQLSEEDVRSYLLELRKQGAARGTFKIGLYGLRFFYQHTLGRRWDLFRGKKGRRTWPELTDEGVWYAFWHEPRTSCRFGKRRGWGSKGLEPVVGL